MQPPLILRRSERWVAIDKPSGLVIHRSRGANDRHNVISVMRDLLGPDVFPVNRLDRPTSGVVLMALDKEAARELSGAFAERLVKKTYEAVVRGWPPLLPGERHRIERSLDEKPACTDVEALCRTELDLPLGRYPTTRLTRLRLHPASGLHHQIRRHLKGWGYPILNDRAHGDSQLNAKFLEAFGIKRLLLHSRRLEFPFQGQMEVVEANWNGRSLGLLDVLGLRLPPQPNDQARSESQTGERLDL